MATTTFVFVTSRRWTGKKDWEKSKRDEGKWRDVRVFDVDDIEQALEGAAAVRIWLSELLGIYADNTIDEEHPSALLEVATGHRKPTRWVFVSYVRDDSAVVDQLCVDLKNAGVLTWRDIDQLLPGDDWKLAIRRAIEGGAGFIACFSQRSEDRFSSYMREELVLAIEQLRQRPADSGWFMPVLLDDVMPPDTPVGAGRTLRDLHFIRWQEPRSQPLTALLAALDRLR